MRETIMSLRAALSRLREAPSSPPNTSRDTKNNGDCRDEFESIVECNEEQLLAMKDDFSLSCCDAPLLKDEYEDNEFDRLSEVAWLNMDSNLEVNLARRPPDDRVVGWESETSWKEGVKPLLSEPDVEDTVKTSFDGVDLLDLDDFDDSFEEVLWKKTGAMPNGISVDECEDREVDLEVSLEETIVGSEKKTVACTTKRRFPGPAGILPKMETCFRLEPFEERTALVRPPLTPCIQEPQNKRHKSFIQDECFLSKAWIELEQDLNSVGSLTPGEGSLISDEGPLIEGEGSLVGSEGYLTPGEGSLVASEGSLAST
jgi:hypothetical protein